MAPPGHGRVRPVRGSRSPERAASSREARTRSHPLPVASSVTVASPAMSPRMVAAIRSRALDLVEDDLEPHHVTGGWAHRAAPHVARRQRLRRGTRAATATTAGSRRCAPSASHTCDRSAAKRRWRRDDELHPRRSHTAMTHPAHRRVPGPHDAVRTRRPADAGRHLHLRRARFVAPSGDQGRGRRQRDGTARGDRRRSTRQQATGPRQRCGADRRRQRARPRHRPPRRLPSCSVRR